MPAGAGSLHKRSGAGAGPARQAVPPPWASNPGALACLLLDPQAAPAGTAGPTSGSVMVMPSHAPSPAWLSCMAGAAAGQGTIKGTREGKHRFVCLSCGGAAGVGGHASGHAPQHHMPAGLPAQLPDRSSQCSVPAEEAP